MWVCVEGNGGGDSRASGGGGVGMFLGRGLEARDGWTGAAIADEHQTLRPGLRFLSVPIRRLRRRWLRCPVTRVQCSR